MKRYAMLKQFLCISVSVCAAVSFGRTVKVSDFGFDAEDSTRFLQHAFDSGADKVVVDRQVSDWIAGPLLIRSGTEVVLADGVTVRAKKGLFKDPGDFFFYIHNATNVILRGEGKASIVMNRADYQDKSRYAFSEWRHAIMMRSVKNVKIDNLDVGYSGGDGFDITWGEDIELSRIDFHHHHRLPGGIVSAKNVTIRQCRFADTDGTSPAYGFDLEPNHAWERIENIVFDDCDFTGNLNGGFVVHFLKMNAGSTPVSAVIRNCRMTNSRGTGCLLQLDCPKGAPVKGELLFENCTFSGDRERPLCISSKSAAGVYVRFRDCTFDARGCEDGSILFSNAELSEDVAGVAFENTRLITESAQPVKFVGMAGTGIRHVDGHLTVERGGQTTDYDFSDLPKLYPSDPELRKAFEPGSVDYKHLKPLKAEASAPTVAYPYLRGRFTFVQSLPLPGEYTVVFKTRILESRPQPLKIPVKLSDKYGTDLGTVYLTNAVQTVTTYSGDVGNVRRYEVGVNTRYEAVTVFSSHPGQGLRLDDRTHFLCGDGCHRLHFLLPKGSDSVRIEVLPDEPAAVSIFDATGTCVFRDKQRQDLHFATATFEPLAEAQVWSFEIDAIEDVRIRLAAPAVPIAATAPDAIIVPAVQ